MLPDARQRLKRRGRRCRVRLAHLAHLAQPERQEPPARRVRRARRPRQRSPPSHPPRPRPIAIRIPAAARPPRSPPPRKAVTNYRGVGWALGSKGRIVSYTKAWRAFLSEVEASHRRRPGRGGTARYLARRGRRIQRAFVMADRRADRRLAWEQARERTGEGLVRNLLLGVIGAIVDGALFHARGYVGVTGLNLRSIVVAVVGSAIFLVTYHVVTGQQAARAAWWRY